MTIGHNSGNFAAQQITVIADIRNNWEAARGRAVHAAKTYVRYGLSTRNMDLLRHLFDALPPEAQARFKKWISLVAPIEVRASKSGTSFGLDRERAKTHGLGIYEENVFEDGFLAFTKKREKKEKDATDIVVSAKRAIERIAKELSKVGAREVARDLETLAANIVVPDNFGEYEFDPLELPALPGQEAA